MFMKGLLTYGLVIACMSTSALATDVVAPTTTVQSFRHFYSPNEFDPPGTSIEDKATLVSGNLVYNASRADRFVAQVRAPSGFKFDVSPAPGGYDTTLFIQLLWGLSSAVP